MHSSINNNNTLPSSSSIIRSSIIKIVNVRIRSSITQNGINNHHRNRSSIHNNNNYNDNNNNNNNHQLIMDNINPSDSLYHQLIGSNLHHHEYHHYFHNKQIENILNYSNAVKSNMFNTLKTFIKHYKKYGGLLIPQNAPHLNNTNHANHLQNHRITGNDVDHTSIDDMLGNIMFNMLRNKNNHNDDNTDSNDDESNNDSNDEKKNDNDNNYASYSYSNLFQTLQQKNNDDNKNCYALNPFFYIKRRKHDLFSYFSFSYQIGKYQRNELQPEIHSMHHHGVNNDNNNNINNNHNNNNNHNGNNNKSTSSCDIFGEHDDDEYTKTHQTRTMIRCSTIDIAEYILFSPFPIIFHIFFFSLFFFFF